MSTDTDTTAQDLALRHIAVVADPEAAGLHLVTEPELGQVVWTYTRGRVRQAVITKVGPKRVTVLYTTQGALDTSRRIWESHMGEVPEAVAKGAARLAGQNWDYHTSKVDGTCELFAQFNYGPEERAKAAQESAAHLAGRSREAYMATAAEQAREQSEARKALARERGPLGFVHFTTKSVKREDVWA